MVFLRNLYILIILSFAYTANALVLDFVEIEYTNTSNSEVYQSHFNKFINQEVSIDTIRENVRYFSYDPSLKSMEFEIVERGNSTGLILTLDKKIRIKDIKVKEVATDEFEGIVVEEELKQLLTIKEGSFYDPKAEKVLNKIIDKYLSEKGVSKSHVKISKNVENFTMNYILDIEILEFIKIRNINVKNSDDPERDRIYFNDLISKFRGKNWDKLKVKLSLDSVTSMLYENGYYFSTVTPEYKTVDENNIDLILNADFGPQVSFLFRGNEKFSHQELLKQIKDQLKTDSSKLSLEGMSSILKNIYESTGVYNSEFRIREEKGRTKFNDKYHFFFVQVREGEKLKIRDFNINGFKKVSYKELMDIYYEYDDSLVQRGFLNEDYLEDYKDKVKKYYLNKGYLFVSISDPKISKTDQKNVVDINMLIKEYRQTKVSKIVISGVEADLQKELLNRMSNKVAEEFRVLDLEADLETTINLIKEQGYYYAKYKSLQEKDILKYSKDYSNVEIHLDVETSSLTKLKNLVITGHETTRKYVIEREIRLKKDDIITPNIIRNIRGRLGSLSLFSNVKITPVLEESSNELKGPNTNLLVHVSEKDFGQGEISLGYRTDTGIRGAIGVNYNNIDGRNWTVSSKLETNYRVDLDTLDSRRRSDGNKFIEWDANLGILFPYIGNFPIRSEISTSHKRQRYITFDAKIFTLQIQEAFDLNRYTSFSLKYQLDTVDQYDATNVDFNDNFQIGSITPSVTFDFRDSPINPRKGAFFGLSWEIANPSLFSNDDDQLIVDFDKIISRNKFYFPFSPYYGIALSISAGMETNNATDPRLDDSGNLQYDNGTLVTTGYIPSIRVFRLDGQDTVRGFSDPEINLLDSGDDISSVAIRNNAYFVNAKFEIRNFINDLMIAGLFFDAGRIYINHFKPLDLRTSAGATFKIVTPVGSLDFDYGVKLRRLEYSAGQRETFGRFHLSIGFF